MCSPQIEKIVWRAHLQPAPACCLGFLSRLVMRFRKGPLVHVRSLSLLIVDIPHLTDVIKISMFFISARKNPQDSRVSVSVPGERRARTRAEHARSRARALARKRRDSDVDANAGTSRRRSPYHARRAFQGQKPRSHVPRDPVRSRITRHLRLSEISRDLAISLRPEKPRSRDISIPLLFSALAWRPAGRRRRRPLAPASAREHRPGRSPT